MRRSESCDSESELPEEQVAMAEGHGVVRVVVTRGRPILVRVAFLWR